MQAQLIKLTSFVSKYKAYDANKLCKPYKTDETHKVNKICKHQKTYTISKANTTCKSRDESKMYKASKRLQALQDV